MTIKGIFTGDRQTSVEAIEIAASGKVKCNYVVRGLSELETYVPAQYLDFVLINFTLLLSVSMANLKRAKSQEGSY